MSLSRLANILGFAGLIPFVVFSLASWLSLPYVEDAHSLLSTYAAVILSFMGAVHWGAAMTTAHAQVNQQLGWSVLPALLAWLALLLPTLYGYSVLIISFSLLCIADRQLVMRNYLPAWYAPLRTVLTTVVVVCLLVAALASLYGDRL